MIDESKSNKKSGMFGNSCISSLHRTAGKLFLWGFTVDTHHLDLMSAPCCESKLKHYFGRQSNAPKVR